jgi:hypothetical protein
MSREQSLVRLTGSAELSCDLSHRCVLTVSGRPSGGRPPGDRRPRSRQQRILQLAQPKAGEPLAEPRALDGRLGLGLVRGGWRRGRGCAGLRLDGRVRIWFVGHADRHPGKCLGCRGVCRLVFKDGAAKTSLGKPRTPTRLYLPKVLFRRALACILDAELRARAAAVVAAGPQRSGGPAPQPGR